MKRELAYVLDIQSQFTGSLGRTRSSSKPQQPERDLNDSVDQNGGRSNQGSGFHVYRRNKRFKTSRPPPEEEEDVSVINVEETIGELVVKALSKDDKVGAEAEAEAAPSRRFTRSALKPNVVVVDSNLADSNVNVLGTPTTKKLEVVDSNSADSNVNVLGTPTAKKLEVVGSNLAAVADSDVSVLGTPTATKKLELKMSKKIEVDGGLTTVKQLFETGLLEGLPVFYNGGKKGMNLRGVIKGDGILCSCNLCGGSKVIPTSQFEVHACNSYRRATQYICLENGKSLLQVLDICRRSGLGSLEETIQTVIGLFPVKDSYICQNCKGSFLPSCSENVGQLCASCINLIKLEAGPTVESDEKSSFRTSKQVSVSKSSATAEVSTLSRKKSEKKLKRNSLAPASAPILPRSAPKCNVSQEKRQRKMRKRSSKSVMIRKSPGSDSVHVLSESKRKGRISKRLSKSFSAARSSKVATTSTSPEKKSQWKITKKDQQMNRLVFEEGGLPDGSEVAYYSRGQKLLEGYKKGFGIFCFCCNSEVSPSQFEAHAGWASRKKPYGYIYTSNGVSLHEYAISLLKHRSCSSKYNDDLCIICADGGNLLLCDGCPRAFHKECASLASIPRGKWYCKYCENRFQREKFVERNANALAAGRVSGIDPIEQITKRCIRIFKNPEETEVVACLLCRSYDYSKSGFGPRTVILCDQCEKEYHVGCLKKHNMADLQKLPKGKWFCCMDCKKIHSVLQNLLTCEAEKLPDILRELTREKQKDNGLGIFTDIDVRWRLLSGKVASRETKLLLSEAVAIFHDCFDPIIDSLTGLDFIPSLVYGRSIRGQDFGGMYCAILIVNSAVVSAGILRIFGRDIAELPLVATSKCNQGKGCFQLLFSCIEKLLGFLNVKRIVLPAAEEAESIWTNKFGFEKISPEQLSTYRNTCSQMMRFKGTSMLEKVIPQCRKTYTDTITFDLSVE